MIDKRAQAAAIATAGSAAKRGVPAGDVPGSGSGGGAAGMHDQQVSYQRLLEQYTEIARLAGALAHEIKNPLSTIRLNMELLAEELDEDQSPAQRRALKRVGTMQRECQRLQDLLDDFLSFAKVRRLNLRPTDLNEEIVDALEFFGPEARDASVEMVRYLDPELPRVLLDREAFRAALLNLLLNAKQAMAGGGQIVVRTRAEGDAVVLQLIDDGCGMDDHTAQHMFEAFFSTKPSGSGLGLPTTHKIIEAHGGRIHVESELGRGTQFTIELPVPPRLPANEAAS
ncbi:MAG: two-component sensor histidine kinase [Planctomycetales bacterium]|nr:two-component sensor histidine kinase [Planctomycetales bacterium]